MIPPLALLLLPLNNKLLGRKIKHRMSNEQCCCPQLLWPGKLFTDVGRSVTIMTARDNSWHVTMVRSHITHHLLVDRQFRVGHQIWHRGWHEFLCVAVVCCSALPFHCVRTLWTMVIWLNATQGSISPLSDSHKTRLQMQPKILAVFVSSRPGTQKCRTNVDKRQSGWLHWYFSFGCTAVTEIINLAPILSWSDWRS